MRLTALIPQQFRPLPLWCKIALPVPQALIRVSLAFDDDEIDVTANCVIAALKPLTVGIGFNKRTIADMGSSEGTRGPLLKFIDHSSGRILGELRLRLSQYWSTAAHIRLFEVTRGEQACVGRLSWAWNRWLQERGTRKNQDRHNFVMDADAMQQVAVFYICPQPVVFTSVADELHSNMFPMDLIGPIEK